MVATKVAVEAGNIAKVIHTYIHTDTHTQTDRHTYIYSDFLEWIAIFQDAK